MTTSARRRRLRATIASLTVLAALAACAPDGAPVPLQSYTVDAAGTALTLYVEVTSGATVSAAVAQQDDDAVTVEVRAVAPTDTFAAVMVGETTSVTLDEPLGDRMVVDASSDRPAPEGDPLTLRSSALAGG